MQFVRRNPALSVFVGAVGLFVGVWLLAVRPAPATAQIPDSGRQRVEMIRELREINQQLKEVTKLLKDIRDQGREKTPKPPGRP